MRRAHLFLVVLLAIFARTIVAQAAYVTNASGPVAWDAYLPSALFPVGSTSQLGPMLLPNWAAVATPLPPFINGGGAVNGLTGAIYTTDGVVMTIDANPRFGGPFVTSPAFPVAGLVTPGALITGLGWGPQLTPAGSLLFTSSTEFQFRAPAPPYVALAPVVTPTFLAGQITDGDYDPATGTVWLVDDRGNVYNCTMTGAPIGVQPVAICPPTVIPGGNIMTGIAVNRTNGPGAFPAPLASTQIPGYYICVTNGSLIVDALNLLNPWLPTGTFGPSYDLAFTNDYQIHPGTAAPSNIAQIRTGRPTHNSFAGPNVTIDLVGAFPFQAAILAYDLVPSTPTGVPWGGSIFLNTGTLFLSPTYFTNGAGNYSLPIPAGAPAGVQFSCFWIYQHLFNAPFYISHTDLMEITIGEL